jgi:hypothetical protein
MKPRSMILYSVGNTSRGRWRRAASCTSVSGNTPAAGLQSLIRGLLLGSHNLAKLPAAGLSDLAQFREALPRELAENVEFSSDLPEEWLARAEAAIVFGSDETIAHFRGRVRSDQTFIAHGHRLSFGVIFDDPAFASVADAGAGRFAVRSAGLSVAAGLLRARRGSPLRRAAGRGDGALRRSRTARHHLIIRDPGHPHRA